MELLNQTILAIIQGITEFLPISSSGHLAIFQNILGKVNVNLDIFFHLATLLSVLVYFFKDIKNIILDFLTFKKESENFRIALFIILASIPIAICGFFFKKYIYYSFSITYIVSIGFIITGLFLFNASLKKQEKKKLSIKNTFAIGISQALALIPGISRSGSTVSTGILLGISKEKAIRFSFILAIPAILGATILNIEDINFTPGILIPFFVCFLMGLFSIYLFLNKIKTKNLKYFAYYCWLLAIIILILKFLAIF
jgi:undecaprenyl-diphosphatase